MAKNSVQDLNLVLKDLRKRHQSSEDQSSQQVIQKVVQSEFKQTKSVEKPQIPLPSTFLPIADAEDDSAPLAKAILAKVSDRMVSFTGKVNLRGKGVTPSVAKLLLLRLAEVEGSVRDVDVSSNSLKSDGLAEVFLGLVGKKELMYINASECGVDLQRVDDGLSLQQLAKAGVDELKNVRHRVEESGRKVEDAFIAMLKDKPKLETINLSHNQLDYFGIRMLHRGLLIYAGAGLAMSLVELKLAHAHLRTEKACRCLKMVLTSLKNLKSLDISYNSIRGSGAQAVAEGLKACVSLEEVNLSNNGFGDPEPARVLGMMLSGVKWGGRNRPGKELCACKIRRLDVSYNRFTFVRDGEWPPKAGMLSWLVSLLPDLIPLLHRFPEGDDPCAKANISSAAKSVRGKILEFGELDRLRHRVEQIRTALDTELRLGRYTGTAVALLGGLSAESNQSLEWLDVGGHVLSEDAEGVVAHIVSRMTRESQLEVASFAAKGAGKDERGVPVVLKAARATRFPRSATAANGLRILEVGAAQQHIVVEHGVEETLTDASKMVQVLHHCEIAFSGRPEHGFDAPAPRKPRGLQSFLPPDQLELEKELADRIRERKALMEAANPKTRVHPSTSASSVAAATEASQEVDGGELRVPAAKAQPSMLSVFSTASTESAVPEKSLLFSEPSLVTEPAIEEDEDEEIGLGAPAEQHAENQNEDHESGTEEPKAIATHAASDDDDDDTAFSNAVASFQTAITGWKAEWIETRPAAKPPAAKSKSKRSSALARRSSLLGSTLRQGPLLLLKYGAKVGRPASTAPSAAPRPPASPPPASSAARPEPVPSADTAPAEQEPASAELSDEPTEPFDQTSDADEAASEDSLPQLPARMLGEAETGASRKHLAASGSHRTGLGALPPQAQHKGQESELILSAGVGIGEMAETAHALAAAKLQSAFSKPKGRVRSPMIRAAKPKGEGDYWGVLRRKQHIGASRSDMTKVADPEGSDLHFSHNPDMPTFACPERIDVGGERRGKFGALIRVEGAGEYAEQPRFFRGRGLPSSEEELQSLNFEGDTIRLATVAAEHREDPTFWRAIASIRQSWPSEGDASVAASVFCPALLVIGEPFYFTYVYSGAESRLPDSFNSDWIGLYRVGGEGNEEDNEDGEEGSGLLIARFRPPHGVSAEVQLRHVMWEPGQYQFRLNQYNSDRCIGTSNVCLVKYASASLSCPEEVIIDEGAFEVTVITDYTSLLHPTTDWLGVFPKNTTYLTTRHAAKTFPAPEKNMGKVTVDTAHLEGEYDIFYFQELGGRSRVMGHCETLLVPKPPKPPDKFVKETKSASEQRHLTFYLSGTCDDFERERELLYSKVVPALQHVCDTRRLSVSFMDLRFGVGSDVEEITRFLTEDSDETLIDRCLVELERCVPYFLCLLGHVYGKVPNAIPRRTAHLYPWLADRRYQNIGVTHGARLSLTEMEIVNTILVDKTMTPHARFYLRDQSYTVGRGITFADPEEWAKIAMSTLKARIKRAVEASARIDPVRCMKMHSYYHPSSFADCVLKDIIGILDMDYGPSDAISEFQLFWTTMDAVSNQHRFHLDNQIPREIEKMDELCEIIDSQFFTEVAQQTSKKIVLTGPAGAGKSASIVRWVQQVGKRANRENDAASWRQNCTWVKDGGGDGRDMFLAAFFCGMHQRLRDPHDLLRTLMQTLTEVFSFPLVDEELLDENVHAALALRIEAAARHTSLLLVIDGVDSYEGELAVDWLPLPALKGVHWLLSSSDENQIRELVETKGFQRIDVDELVEEQREGLVQSMIKRHKPEIFREHIEIIKEAALAERPQFLIAAMDLMRMSTAAEQAEAHAIWFAEFQDMESLHIAIIRQWCDDVKGLRDMLCFLSLSETGLYEHELMQLLQVPQRLSCVHWLDLIKTTQETTFVFCGVRSMFNQHIARLFTQRVMTEDDRLSHLRDMERFFGAMPTCNRKIAEYPFVLEKMHDWNGMYMYITDIPIFRIMYSDPIRKQQFLHYIARLGKSSEEVQRTLRAKFESHFSVSHRWFCDGPVLYYELNPKIYRSDVELLYFDDVVYYVSSFFELHGQHADSLRDLETSLKALYGTSDIFKIPRLHSEHCRFPRRVSRLLRRLARLYSLHLRALYEHWMAIGDDGLPKHQVPEYMDGVDVSWWTTPVPVGGARTLPMKLKLVYLLARMIADDPAMACDDVHAVLENESHNKALADLTWNSGLKAFVQNPALNPSLDPVSRSRLYGRSRRDPKTLLSLPGIINHPHALPGRSRSREPADESSRLPSVGQKKPPG